MTDEQQPIPEESLEGIEYVGMTDEPEAPKPDPEAPAEDADDPAEPEATDEDSDEPKGRSKPAKQRIAEITAARRTAERERDAALAELAKFRTAAPTDSAPDATELKAPDPNDDKYEFGKADPDYLADLVEYKAELKAQERATKDAETQRATRAAELGTKLDGDWREMQARGAEKHEDFTEKVDAMQVSQPMLALAIQSSPVGEEAAYHLASNPHEKDLLEAKLAAGDVLGAAEQFGAIDGAFLDKAPDRPTNGNPIDIALYAGRLRAFMAKEQKPKAKLATDAPEPPKEKARGSTGQYETDWSSENVDLTALGKML